jgi:prepilin-type processing-associated H-X9-DG protein
MQPRFGNTMKLHLTTQRSSGWSRFELLVVILLTLLILCLILAMLLPARMAQQRRAHHAHASNLPQRLQCISNLKQIGLAARIWEGDNNNRYPMNVSVTNGGAMELIDAGDVASCFQVMSNELSTPKILVCPADVDRVSAKNFTTDFDKSHISYFLSLDASEIYPQMILSGDDNLTMDGVPVEPGVLDITHPDAISWTAARHKGGGNIGFADGSVWEKSPADLQTALQNGVGGTPFSTNRFALP